MSAILSFRTQRIMGKRTNRRCFFYGGFSSPERTLYRHHWNWPAQKQGISSVFFAGFSTVHGL